MTVPLTAEVPLTTGPARTTTAVANEPTEGMMVVVVVVVVVVAIVAVVVAVAVVVVVTAVVVVVVVVIIGASVVPTPITPHPMRAPEFPVLR